MDLWIFFLVNFGNFWNVLFGISSFWFSKREDWAHDSGFELVWTGPNLGEWHAIIRIYNWNCKIEADYEKNEVDYEKIKAEIWDHEGKKS